MNFISFNKVSCKKSKRLLATLESIKQDMKGMKCVFDCSKVNQRSSCLRKQMLFTRQNSSSRESSYSIRGTTELKNKHARQKSDFESILDPKLLTLSIPEESPIFYECDMDFDRRHKVLLKQTRKDKQLKKNARKQRRSISTSPIMFGARRRKPFPGMMSHHVGFVDNYFESDDAVNSATYFSFQRLKQMAADDERWKKQQLLRDVNNQLFANLHNQQMNEYDSLLAADNRCLPPYDFSHVQEEKCAWEGRHHSDHLNQNDIPWKKYDDFNFHLISPKLTKQNEFSYITLNDRYLIFSVMRTLL